MIIDVSNLQFPHEGLTPLVASGCGRDGGSAISQVLQIVIGDAATVWFASDGAFCRGCGGRLVVQSPE